ncbi:hypothetical protein H5410_004442 [Solanum commersonii]|uniref:Uncharacterized protein n=1 Tax=Solanum commersonii TaxID=4109 RepID=A0A9J6B7D8_SOLCO|nr:hypothetical protein H5410_004442 [Solanum commersonii]
MSILCRYFREYRPPEVGICRSRHYPVDQWLHELVLIEVPRLVVGSELSVLPIPTFEEPIVTCTSLLVVPSLLAYHRHPHLAPFFGELCHASNNVGTTDLPPPSQPIAFQKVKNGLDS